jgi:hypothetical protein
LNPAVPQKLQLGLHLPRPKPRKLHVLPHGAPQHLQVYGPHSTGPPQHRHAPAPQGPQVLHGPHVLLGPHVSHGPHVLHGPQVPQPQSSKWPKGPPPPRQLSRNRSFRQLSFMYLFTTLKHKGLI